MRKTRGKSCFLNLGRHATEWSCDLFTFYQLAAHESHSWLILRLLYVFCFCLSVCVGLCVSTYHVRNNYITYFVGMRLYFSRLGKAALVLV